MDEEDERSFGADGVGKGHREEAMNLAVVGCFCGDVFCRSEGERGEPGVVVICQLAEFGAFEGVEFGCSGIGSPEDGHVSGGLIVSADGALLWGKSLGFALAIERKLTEVGNAILLDFSDGLASVGGDGRGAYGLIKLWGKWQGRATGAGDDHELRHVIDGIFEANALAVDDARAVGCPCEGGFVDAGEGGEPGWG